MKKDKRNRRRRYYRYGGVVLDVVIALFGVGVIVTALILFINFSRNVALSPIVLGLASCMDIGLSIKYIKRHDKLRYISFIIQAVVLMAAAIVVFLAVR